MQHKILPGRGSDDDGPSTLVACDPDGALVAIDTTTARNQTRVVVRDLGGIPSNDGLVAGAAGSGVVYAPLVNYAKNALATVDTATGHETQQALPWTVNYPVFVAAVKNLDR